MSRNDLLHTISARHAISVRRTRWLAAVAATVVVAGSAPATAAAPTPRETVVATVDDRAITVTDVERELARRGAARSDNADLRRDLLDEMVDHRLRVAAARAAGYADDPDIVRALEVLLASKLMRERLEPLLAALEVTDDEVAAHFQATRERYRTPEKVRAAIVQLDVPEPPSDDARAQLAQTTATILAAVPAIDPTQGFGDLARSHSADRASRYVGGVMGWLVRGDRYRWPAEVVDGAFSLAAPGDVEVIEVVGEGPDGAAHYLVRLMARQPAAVRPFDQVRDGVRRELLRDKRTAARRDFHTELARRYRVEIDTEALEVATPPTRRKPPSIPGH